MTIASGTRLGPYEVVHPIGAGGMGEVYKARDTRLDRSVAIKILPAAFAADPDRRERFRREARAVSQLTHAHVCTLYDVGDHEGLDYLVMEYLAGSTLAERLRRGPLPVDEMLRIGAQLAEALDAAHRQGIAHRDFKPANIMLTASGAKVLDFGLAKSYADPAAAVVEQAMTAHPTITQLGTVVGTLQYMAPEQVEGNAADARSDVFALGAVLYEMATGNRAFTGSSPSAVMAAILTATPERISIAQPLTPPGFEHVVRNCLAKNPDDRWQNAGDIARELRWIAESRSSNATAAGIVVGASRARYAWIAATVVIAAVAALLGVYGVRQLSPDARPIRLVLPPPEGAAYSRMNDVESPPVVSPDGRHVAFVAHRVGDLNSVWVRSLDSLAARALPGTEGVPDSSTWLFWSPDSRSIGFFAGGKLKRVELTGGAPQALADAPDGRGGSWSSRGVIVFTPTSAGALYSVPASGGEAKPISKLAQSEGGHRWPVFLPDGRHFLFRRRGAPPYGTTEAGSLDAGEMEAVLTGQDTVLNVAFSTTGHLLYVRDHTLFARPFDVDRLRTTGAQTVLAEGVEGEPGSGAAFSISANGVLVYRMTATPIVSRLRWVDRAGRVESDLDAEGTQDGVSLSTDGLRIAFHRLRPSEIWLVGPAGGTPSRFTFDGGNFSPVWSPDGRQVAYSTQRRAKVAGQPTMNAVSRRNSTGSGEQEQLATGRFSVLTTDWSPDGRSVIYADQDPETKNDLWAVPVEGDHKPILLVRTEGEDTFGQVSPDGRWLSYVSTVTGREEVYIQEFPAPRGKWQVSTNGGTQPRWRRDGKELFYVSADGQLTSVTIMAGPDGIDVSKQNRLFPLRVFGEDYTYAVSPDGRRFLVNTIVRDSAQPIVVVLNWTADLKP